MNFSIFNLGGKKEITLAAAVPEKKVVEEKLPTEQELRAKRAKVAFLAAQGDFPKSGGTPPAAQDAISTAEQRVIEGE
jgi:hypothetical protein